MRFPPPPGLIRKEQALEQLLKDYPKFKDKLKEIETNMVKINNRIDTIVKMLSEEVVEEGPDGIKTVKIDTKWIGK